MLNNDHLNKLEIKKRLLEKLNTISGNQADQESQIMISYSAKKENYIDVNDSEIDKDFLDAKLITSSIYISSILPKIESLQTIIMNGDEDVLSMKQNWL